MIATAPESIEEFVSSSIKTLFAVSFTPTDSEDVIYLEGLVKELESEGGVPTLLDESILDRVFMEIICLPAPLNGHFLNYPIACYKRIQAKIREQVDEERIQILKDFSKLALSYLALAMKYYSTIPSIMSTDPSIPISEFLDVLAEKETEMYSPSHFLDDLVEILVETYDESSNDEILHFLFTELSTRVMQMTAFMDIEPSFKALKVLLKNKFIKTSMIELSNWNYSDRGTGKEIEVFTVLGAFFRLSTFNDSQPRHMVDAEKAEKGRKNLKIAQKYLLEVIVDLLDDEDTELAMYEWFEDVLYRNLKRNALTADKFSFASEGFMLNICKTLVQLCQHYGLNQNNIHEYIHEISMGSFPGLMGNLTRIIADSETAEVITSELRADPRNTQHSLPIFLFSYAILSIDLASFTTYGRLLEDHRYPSQQDKYMCIELQFMEESWVDQILEFLCTIIRWLVFIGSNSREITQVPLPGPSKVYQILPECFIEVTISLITVLNTHKEKFAPVSGLCMDFMVALIGSPQYTLNPYLRAQITPILNDWSQAFPNKTSNNPFFTDIATQYLGPSLSNLFVNLENEITSQFLEKHNFRLYINSILTYLWGFEEHKHVLTEYWRTNSTPFFSTLINEIMFLLDEYFSAHTSSGDTYEQRDMIFTFLRVALEPLLQLVRDITDILSESKILEKMAALLNYASSRIHRYKQSAEQSDTTINGLESRVVAMYVCLYRGNKGFVDYLVKDEKPTEDLEAFLTPLIDNVDFFNVKDDLKSLVMELDERKQKIHDIEEKIGEVPEEFMDPIINIIMKDPVKLPSSGVVVDRSTIEKHLLSDQSDPFNRLPLKNEELIPQEELKNKIQDFIKERLNI